MMKGALASFCWVAVIIVLVTTIVTQVASARWSSEASVLLPALGSSSNSTTRTTSVPSGSQARIDDEALRPILFLHGINGHADEFDGITRLISNTYGSRAPPMHSIDICEGPCSLLNPLPKQRDDMLAYLTKNAAALGIDGDEGFNFVAHSQGALLARSVIQKLPPSLHVRTYVSMASPQMGQFGECNKDNSGIGPALAREMARPAGWIFFYNPVAQRGLSVANYWHDPRHMSLFIKETNFLPEINGYVDSGDIAAQKANFVRIGKAVFLSSEDDDCINPPLSGIFQFLDDNGDPTSLEQSYEYSQDSFGLKTMHDEDRLVIENHPGNLHDSWVQNTSIFETYVLPHLQ
mmetsp:Transcript_4184/g.8211  ORF Transcript_4184/g.8211 Transcript_4184/m.8211 type:complete len:349 (+) Transcript_4184:10-1056(+)